MENPVQKAGCDQSQHQSAKGTELSRNMEKQCVPNKDPGKA